MQGFPFKRVWHCSYGCFFFFFLQGLFEIFPPISLQRHKLGLHIQKCRCLPLLFPCFPLLPRSFIRDTEKKLCVNESAAAAPLRSSKRSASTANWLPRKPEPGCQPGTYTLTLFIHSRYPVTSDKTRSPVEDETPAAALAHYAYQWNLVICDGLKVFVSLKAVCVINQLYLYL